MLYLVFDIILVLKLKVIKDGIAADLSSDLRGASTTTKSHRIFELEIGGTCVGWCQNPISSFAIEWYLDRLLLRCFTMTKSSNEKNGESVVFLGLL